MSKVAFPVKAAGRHLAGIAKRVWQFGIGRSGAAATYRSQIVAERLGVRIGLLVAGSALIAVGVALTVKAGLGVGPMDVVLVGLTKSLGVSFAVAVWILVAVMSVGVVAVGRRPTFGGIAPGLWIGAIIDAALQLLPSPDTVTGQAVYLAGGLVVLVFGIEVSAAASLGRGNSDLFVAGVTAKVGGDQRLVRSIFELALLGSGMLLGGTVGVGTVAAALAIGPLLAGTSAMLNDYVVGRRIRLGLTDRSMLIVRSAPAPQTITKDDDALHVTIN